MKIKNWLATVAVISSAFVIGCSSETESSGKKVEEQQDAVQKIENITILKYKEMKFEEKMAKLEELVSELEKDDIKIDDSAISNVSGAVFSGIANKNYNPNYDISS